MVVLNIDNTDSDESQGKVHLTKDGLKDLQRELDQLKKDKRPIAVDRLAVARTLGDLAENNEYSQAKEDLALIDGRISELEDVIVNAVVIDKNSHSSHVVTLGSRVTVYIDGQEIIFHLVGEWEADPISQKISHKSPLGQQLIGRKPGDEVEVEAPVGKLVYRIIKIE